MWWKALSILLIVYSIIVGLAVPLKPGIVDVSPRRATLGDSLTIHIKGYNTHFNEDDKLNLKSWLKLDTIHTISHLQVYIKDENEVNLTYLLPSYFPSKRDVSSLTLILQSERDGLSVLPNALIVRKDVSKVNPKIRWDKNSIKGLKYSSAMRFPYRNILQETIRALYYHVPLWFAMIALLAMAAWNSSRFLMSGNIDYDYKTEGLTFSATLFGILGLITGAIWANYTWGKPWSWDVKQNMAAIAMMMYCSYFVLRSALRDHDRKARLSAIYNIFSFVCVIPLLFIIPRLVDSLHPGSGGNPGFGGEDLDNTMRLVFYPAIIGWGLFGFWIANIRIRINRLRVSLLTASWVENVKIE